MTANAHEQLSALLDGELPQTEVAMAVRRVTRDPAMRATAMRYSLIGDTLRDELPAGRPADLVARVSAALDAAPATAAAVQKRFPHLGRYGAGLAVAASVAMVALLALPGRQQVDTPPMLSATEVASPGPDQRMMLQPVYTRAAGGGPDRLTRYYVNHTGYAPPVSGRGALTRIIIIQPEAATAEEERSAEESELREENGNAR